MSIHEEYSYINAEQLGQYSEDYIRFSGYRAKQEEAAKSFDIEKMPRTGLQIFLSHSHQDSKLVHLVVGLLHRHGAEAYIDWLDPSMPKVTNNETAKRLRNTIGSCNKFVMLASKKALDSHWVPWELGFADSKKGIANLAVLPIEEQSGEWIGNEYVGIYPYIMKVESDQYFVVTNDNKSTPLSDWLR